MCIYVRVCIHTYIYIYIYRERNFIIEMNVQFIQLKFRCFSLFQVIGWPLGRWQQSRPAACISVAEAKIEIWKLEAEREIEKWERAVMSSEEKPLSTDKDWFCFQFYFIQENTEVSCLHRGLNRKYQHNIKFSAVLS